MKLWHALAAAGGALLLGAAAAEREPIKQAVRKGARKVVETVGGVSQEALDSIARYDVWGLLAKYGDKVPPAVAAAIIDIETGGTFNPYIYNYTVPGGYGVDYATPGAPSVPKWTKPGDGGFAHDPHAVGLFQILDYWRLANGKKTGTPNFAGYPLPMLTDLVDPEKNVAAGLKNLNIQWARLQRLMPQLAGPEFWLALYYAHNQGGGAFEKIASGGATSLRGLITNAKHLSVAAKVAARVPVWVALAPAAPVPT